ncbi:MAG: CHAT domain-containing protein [Leptolyngbyaceae cyanobacterium SL_7_1]|nr:CHAT domain-containing protein [Leptolyngbyaceae cyanobacterium SL_7_1]
MTQDFHISVTPLGDEEFLVRTERVAQGVPLGEEQVVWAIDSWLDQARHLLNDPLVTLLENPTAASQSSSDRFDETINNPSLNLIRLGQQFYQALFQGSLRDSWVSAQGIAHHRGEMLRLRLGLRGLQLPRLPWEVLCESNPAMEPVYSNPRLGLMFYPLTTGINVLFSRYLTGMRLMRTPLPSGIAPGQPLRILMAIASPSDQDRLNLRREAMLLSQELSSSGASGFDAGIPDVQLTILEQPGREELTQALEQGDYQVFHYAGHSSLGASGGNLYLVNRDTGLTEILRGDDLAGLLVNNNVYMAVFNSCQGSFPVADQPAVELEGWNLAEALISRGVPAAVVMAEQIPDNVALAFSRLFYRNLKQGYPIDLSLNRARQGLISSYGSRQLYWALPILYMHPEFDGYLVSSERATTDSTDRQLFSSLISETPVGLAFGSAQEASTSLSRDLEIISQAIVGGDEDLDEVEEIGYEALLIDDELEVEPDEAIAAIVEDLSATPTPSSPPTPTAALLLPGLTANGLDLLQSSPPPYSPFLVNPTEDIPIPSNAPTTIEVESVSPVPTRSITPRQPRASNSRWRLTVAAAVLGAVGLGAVLLAPLLQQPQPPEIAESPTVPALPSPTPASPSPLPTESVSPTPAEEEAIADAEVDQAEGGNAAPPPRSAVTVSDRQGTTPRRPQRDTDYPQPTPPRRVETPPPAISIDEADLVGASQAELESLAIRGYRQPSGANVAVANEAVKILLDYSDLQRADMALQAANAMNIGNAETTFLRGRFAWQAGRSGYAGASAFADAQIAWKAAVDRNPGSPLYRNALALAYYVESQSSPNWSDLEWQAIATLDAGDTDCYSNPTSCAIRALILLEQSKRDASQQEALIHQVVALRDQVLAADPNGFYPSNLEQEWVWLPSAIDNWQAVLNL